MRFVKEPTALSIGDGRNDLVVFAKLFELADSCDVIAAGQRFSLLDQDLAAVLPPFPLIVVVPASGLSVGLGGIEFGQSAAGLAFGLVGFTAKVLGAALGSSEQVAKRDGLCFRLLSNALGLAFGLFQLISVSLGQLFHVLGEFCESRLKILDPPLVGQICWRRGYHGGSGRWRS